MKIVVCIRTDRKDDDADNDKLLEACKTGNYKKVEVSRTGSLVICVACGGLWWLGGCETCGMRRGFSIHRALRLTFDSVNHVWSQQILAQGVDANVFDANADGRTPLQWAVMNKHSQVAKLLISKGTIFQTIP